MKASDCGYTSDDRNAAPTVCAEGTNNTGGTHGTMHNETDRVTETNLGQAVSIDQAIAFAAEAHKNAMNEDFGEPSWYQSDHCSEECIREQLKAFYGKFKCQPTVTNKDGGIGSSAGGTSGSGEG